MTASPAIDESLRGFLRDHLESFEQVEVLLFLRDQRDRGWSKDAIADALCIEGNMVAAVLEQLAGKDLIVSSVAGGRGVDTSYRYQPGTLVLARMTRSLAEAWAESRVEVMKIMSVQAVERIRQQVAGAFADGSVLGRKKGL